MNDVKSAKRILEILRFFADTQAPASLSQISGALGFPKSSCLALLETLEGDGYAYQAAGRYYLTRRWLNEAQRVAQHEQITARVRPTLEDLHRRLGETLILARLSGAVVLYLDAIEANQTIRFSAHAGQIKPVHASASGRALLGTLQDAERHNILASATLNAFTDRTVTDLTRLIDLVEEGCRRTWHVNVGEHQGDTLSIASAFGLHGAAYALVVGAPLARAVDRINELGQALADACRMLVGHDQTQRYG